MSVLKEERDDIEMVCGILLPSFLSFTFSFLTFTFSFSDAVHG